MRYRKGRLIFPPNDEFDIELILADQTHLS